MHEKTLQRPAKDAAHHPRVGKPVRRHTFRHAFATHPLNVRVTARGRSVPLPEKALLDPKETVVVFWSTDRSILEPDDR
jgi:hypothetical protein